MNSGPVSVACAQGSHGGDVVRLAGRLGISPTDILDFSSNANSLCDDLTRQVLAQTGYAHSHYPDSECTGLRHRIAGFEETQPERILAGNGSSELIYLAMHSLKPRRVLLIAPVFSEYVRACQACGADYRLFETDPYDGFDIPERHICRLHDAVTAYRPDMAVICAPSNPACTDYSRMDDILHALDCPHVLVDNSYLDFLWGTPAYSRHGMAAYAGCTRTETKVISLRSMTKFFYCTGVRLGYCHADEQTIERMNRCKTPWSVWHAAQQAGTAFLDRMDEYRLRLPAMRAEKTAFAGALRNTGIFDNNLVLEGANFVTARLQRPAKAATVYTELLQHGILVRLCDNIPGMPQGFIRMQVREKKAWSRLTAILGTLDAE
ncbi:pyridoxal phosphate-dependent aminotransferase [Oleidesulfovibrio alaskensis]|jgi:threonine-phosphate decarboxylase|uniref:pyridoxal phosphate-dependent aminotransferase n=1 Tax=Oleidesulfovibrio alaskensis TaxID=58180 RepID=UPI00040762AF|nr:aminotransferase class I/II-fold pyridoxal phosphate-dependent enzyme [Oleidesulfovibrio alaskensis]